MSDSEAVISEPVYKNLEGFAIPGINVPWIKLHTMVPESHPTSEGRQALERLPAYLEAFNAVTCGYGPECQRRGYDPTFIIKQFGHKTPSGTRFVAGRELIFALLPNASDQSPNVDVNFLKMMATEIQREASRILAQPRK